MKKKRFWMRLAVPLVVLLAAGICTCACGRTDETSEKFVLEADRELVSEEDATAKIEKGYDLPIDEAERKEAEADCEAMMERIFYQYEHADKGNAINVVLSDETVLVIRDEVKETGCPVYAMVPYSNMKNYESVDAFLKECKKGKSGSVVIYAVHYDGGIGRRKYIFDGTDMYVLDVRASWSEDARSELISVSYTRINKWKYTRKGWFGYELCVPEPPEVSELVDGSCLIRIKPRTKEEQSMSRKCVQGLGYQGNNLLCSNWDEDHLDKLDYNGMYEYLYEMKYQKKLHSERAADGISKEEFERVIMEYLPVTAEQLQKYAAFDKKKQTYAWKRLGCFNYDLNSFGTSVPEVTGIKKNEDGTVTLTLDAVCEMSVCDEAVITHELTVRFAEDGTFQYVRNKIRGEGMDHIPEYQYRI